MQGRIEKSNHGIKPLNGQEPSPLAGGDAPDGVQMNRGAALPEIDEVRAPTVPADVNLTKGQAERDIPRRIDRVAGGGQLVDPSELNRLLDRGKTTGDALAALKKSTEKGTRTSASGRGLRKLAAFNRRGLDATFPEKTADFFDKLPNVLYRIPVGLVSGTTQAGLWLTHTLEKGVRGSRATDSLGRPELKHVLRAFEEATGPAKVILGRALTELLSADLKLHKKARAALRDVKERTRVLPENDHEGADRFAAAVHLMTAGSIEGSRTGRAVLSIREALEGLAGSDLAFAQGILRGTLPEDELAPDYVVKEKWRGCAQQEIRFLLGVDQRPNPQSQRAQRYLEQFQACESEKQAQVLLRGGASAGLVVYSVLSDDEAPESVLSGCAEVEGFEYCLEATPGYSEDLFHYETQHVEKVEIAGELVGYRAYMLPDEYGNGYRSYTGYAVFDLEGQRIGKRMDGDAW